MKARTVFSIYAALFGSALILLIFLLMRVAYFNGVSEVSTDMVGVIDLSRKISEERDNWRRHAMECEKALNYRDAELFQAGVGRGKIHDSNLSRRQLFEGLQDEMEKERKRRWSRLEAFDAAHAAESRKHFKDELARRGVDGVLVHFNNKE